jgi:hypothetical protein
VLSPGTLKTLNRKHTFLFIACSSQSAGPVPLFCRLLLVFQSIACKVV